MIRDTHGDDAPAILQMIEASGHFDEAGLSHVRETLSAHLRGEDSNIWLTADDGEPVGIAYCAQEQVASGTWNLLMLWTRQDRHGKGHGSALVNELERRLCDIPARLFIVETSSLPSFEGARKFYVKSGFVQEATIKNFFAEGDDKLIFTKQLASA